MTSSQDLVSLLSERFIHKGLKRECSSDVFASWTVSDLRMFLKLSNRNKGCLIKKRAATSES